MASTDTACAPVHEDDDATGRNINTFPSDQLAQHRDDLIAAYVKIRAATEAIAYPLLAEQQSIQSMPDASPVKWHRAHTSWFFETFLLQHYKKRFDWHNVEFCYLFNSYYNGIGKQYPRAERGRMAHPDCEEITAYRSTVDQRMEQMLAGVTDHELGEMAAMLVLGLNHEQQHQELMLTDYQHALSVAPATAPPWPETVVPATAPELQWLKVAGGLVRTGYQGDGFSFDNERPSHQYWLDSYALANRPVINAEYLEFVHAGGYENPLFWLADGWAWLQQNNIHHPRYWRRLGDQWQQFSCCGSEALAPDRPVSNISFYEANAFASWSNARLPTEHEWEHAIEGTSPAMQLNGTGGQYGKLPILIRLPDRQMWLGNVWEWTASPYVAYPRFQPGSGAVGEYNGKFMSSQMVLRGYSGFTASGHSRVSYRNFFYPEARWQQSGIRLARDLLA